MNAEGEPLIRAITRIAVTVSATVALSLPVGYYAIAYGDIVEALEFKARVKASALERVIANNPDTWQFAEERIQGTIAHEPVRLQDERIEIRDPQGALLSEAGPLVSGAAIERRHPLTDAGDNVGWLVIRRPADGLANGIAASTGIGLMLGGVVWLTLHTLPIRILRRTLRQLDDERKRSVTTLQSIADGVITTDAAGLIIAANPVAQNMLGMPLGDLVGRSIHHVVRLEDTANGALHCTSLESAMQTRSPAVCNGRCTLKSATGRCIPIEERATPMLDDAGRLIGGVLCLHDVSATREYLQARTWEAAHDPLTGLDNRRALENRLEAALLDARNRRSCHVLCYMDLDRFKVVNDTCGHAAGDQLLIALAQLMLARVRESDTLARTGGDEFALLLTDCDESRGLLIANELAAAVSAFRFPYDGKTFSVGVSIGLCTITRESRDVATVENEADSACYWAKHQGGSSVSVFVPDNQGLIQHRNETNWVSRIAAALNDERLVLYHQTLLALDQNGEHCRHFEVLLRMVDESGTLVTPGCFLPAAERFHLIADIDRWVIRTVFSNHRKIASIFGDAPLMIGINLSGTTVSSDWLLPLLREEIARHGLDPATICFEIAETTAIRQLQAATRLIRELKAMGFRFALDDFGVGTSSFGYLKNLPVDYLKIDGSFVRDIQHDPVARIMTATINNIGHQLGKLTVAKLVEDRPTVELLRQMGVDYAQGYGICKPGPLLGECHETKKGHEIG